MMKAKILKNGFENQTYARYSIAFDEWTALRVHLETWMASHKESRTIGEQMDAEVGGDANGSRKTSEQRH
jgi:hypothetical protein